MDRRKIKLIISILKLAILLFVIVGIPVYIFTQYPDLLSKLKDVEAVDAYLERYKAKSILVYLGLQTLQVLVSVIPGQILQLTRGYVFNFGAGLLFFVYRTFIRNDFDIFLYQSTWKGCDARTHERRQTQLFCGKIEQQTSI